METKNSQLSIHNIGDSHYNWKGGVIYKRNDGYRYVHTTSDSPYFSMAKKDRPTAKHSGYIAEHRLIMAMHLGRPLTDTEIVHHKNHIKDDNRLENLELMETPGKLPYHQPPTNGNMTDRAIATLKRNFSHLENSQYQRMTIEDLLKLSNVLKPHTEHLESLVKSRLEALNLQRLS